MPSSDHILHTKLIPPLSRPHLVTRTRLLARLDAAVPLTTITAPAGYGKTTLLAHWVFHSEQKTAWLGLDERDNDLPRFLRYLIAALQTVEHTLGRSTLTLLDLPQIPTLENLLTPLLNEISNLQPSDQQHTVSTQGRSPTCLILDDFHEITSPDIHAAITFLLDHLPLNLHLLLASRGTLPFPLAKYRARAQLNEITQDDLRFTDHEVEEFLTHAGIVPSAEHLRALTTRTEGWITGLHLAALALKRNPAALEKISGDHPYIANYLLEEVFRQQPPAVQDFLLRTSLLDRLTPSLCAALLPDTPSPSSIFSHVEQSDLFLTPLDDSRQWFCYHQLFRDFLRARLEVGEAVSLYQRAAHWFYQHHLIPETVEYALKAEDHEFVREIILQRAEEMLARPDARTLRQWCESLPQEMIVEHPALTIRYAWTLSITGNTGSIEPLLHQTESRLNELKSDPAWPAARRKVIRGNIAAIRAATALNKGRLRFAEEQADIARRSIPAQQNATHSLLDQIMSGVALRSGDTTSSTEILPRAIETSRASGNHFVHIVALQRWAFVHVLQARLHESATIYRQIIRYGEEHGAQLLTSAACRYYANNVLFEWNRLADAEVLAQQALEYARLLGNPFDVMESWMILGRIRHAKEETEAGWLALDQALEIAEREGNLDYVHSWRARQALVTGDLAAARRWVQTCGLNMEDDLTFDLEKNHLILANALIHLDNPHPALQLLSRIENNARLSARTHRLIEVKILQAMGCQAIGDIPAALQVTRRALTLAEPHGFVRLFVDQGKPMAALLNQLDTRGSLRQYIGQLLETLKPVEGSGLREESLSPSLQSSTFNLEPLSGREIEILNLLTTGLSNGQIAHKLAVSLNTVRWHNRNIYRKLGVSNRTQAAARARELKLHT